MSLAFNPRQLAEKWVSVTVLTGCILITVGLVYLSMTANALGEGWASDRNQALEDLQ
jgi:hypothetical protein